MDRSPSSSLATARNGRAWAAPHMPQTRPSGRRWRKSNSIFASLSGWSLVEELRSQSLASDLTRTHVAQPMIFAIQAASVRLLQRLEFAPR